MIETIINSFDIWVDAQGIKSRTRVNSVENISLEGIARLRELILELAVRGRLVPQDSNDESVSELLKKIEKEKDKLIKDGKIKKQAPLPEITEDEIPFDVPKSWGWNRLQSLSIYIQRGKGPRYSLDGKVQVVSQKCIQWSGFNLSLAKYIEDSSIKDYQPERFLLNEDLLWNSTGTGTVGRINVLNNIKLDTLVADSHITVIRPLFINSSFLCKFLASPLVQQRIEPGSKNALVSGSTNQVELNTSSVNSVLIPLPPLSEQHRIVAKVDELMALCDKLEEEQFKDLKTHQVLVKTLLETFTQAADANELQAAWDRMSAHFETLFCTDNSIGQLKQTILQLAVMGKLVKQDPNDEPASELLKRIEKERKPKKEIGLSEIKDNEKQFVLAKGWEWIRLQQIIQISSGDGLISSNMNSSGSIPVYGGNGINGYHDKSNVSKPTLVIGRVGYYCGSIHITPSLAWVTDNAFITSFSEDNIYLNFLYWLLKGTNLKENDSATAQPVISGQKVYPVVVAFPPLAEQKRIVDKIDELFALCESLKEKIQKSQDIKVLLSKTIVEKAVQ